MKKIVTRHAVAFAALIACAPCLAADPVSDFYKGKTVYLTIGASIGGGGDLAGRVIARHLGKHIPGNPTVVPQNVSSLALLSQFGSTTPRDGTAIGLFLANMATGPLLDQNSVKYDPRTFNFIMSPVREGNVLVSWHTSPARTVDDLFKHEIIVGSTTAGGFNHDVPLLNNALNGTKFKVIIGYKGTADIKLAMERGELHGNAGVTSSALKAEYAESIAKKQILVVGAFGMEKNRFLPDVPLLPLGKTEEDRQLFQLMYAPQYFGRPFAMPPGVPVERVNAMRVAFGATLKDPGFLADAAKLSMEIDPVSGDELTAVTNKLFETPKEILERMRKMLSAGAGK